MVSPGRQLVYVPGARSWAGYLSVVHKTPGWTLLSCEVNLVVTYGERAPPTWSEHERWTRRCVARGPAPGRRSDPPAHSGPGRGEGRRDHRGRHRVRPAR